MREKIRQIASLSGRKFRNNSLSGGPNNLLKFEDAFLHFNFI